MKRLVLVLVVACGSSSPPASAPRAAPGPAPGPAVTPPAEPAPPPPVAAVQRFADHDQGYAFADPARRARLAAAFPAIDTAVADEMKKRDLKGLAIGIVIDGELAYAKGFGVVDPASKAAPDADTIYRIGSVSKSFTGLALLELRDEGAVELDDPLTKWIPAASGIVYPSRDSRSITLRQLLTHTSGMPRDAGDHRNPSEADIAHVLDGVRLESSPGTQFVYSNTGFGLLSIVVAHAAHSAFRDAMAQRIFRPLGMTATTYAREDVPAAHAAPSIGPDGKVSPDQEILGVEEGAGGIYSSVRDMARYVALELSAYPPRDGAESPVVRRATIREAHNTGFFSGANVRARPDARPGEPTVSLSASTYGFGWGHSHACDADDLVEHNGHIDSFFSVVEMGVSRGVGVVVLSNFGDVGGVADRAFEVLDKTGALKPYVAHPEPSPLLEPAMTKLLAIYNQWDEAALKALLSRPIDPVEHDELAGYKALHGTCTGFTLGEVVSARSAHFTMKCERGTFDLQIDVNAEGKVGGFDGTSTNIPIPPEVSKLAAAAVGLIGRWDEQAYQRSFADAKALHDVYFAGSTQLRAELGACKVKRIAHEVIFWKLDLACTHGALIGNLGIKDGKITSFNVYPPPDAHTTCPTR
ncbi:MAG: serine hydrolase domain-containing protein [Kofleriaceae bacterium]